MTTPLPSTSVPTPMSPRRLRTAKASYTTRHVAASIEARPEGFGLLEDLARAPRAGDVVLARVVELGKHTRLEGPGSRRAHLFVGDEILVAYGPRYAPDQFLAEVPEDLSECHLVAAGGLAGRVVEQHAAIDDATRIQPLGLLATAEGPVNLTDFAPYSVDAAVKPGPSRPTVIGVLGTSMNSGKSTTLACLVRGLSEAGLVVSAGKATGTGAGNDAHLFRDAGAARVLDFTDFGLASTFGLSAEEVREVWSALVDQLALDGPDVVVVEVADGLYQGETARLLGDPAYAGRVDAVVFAAQDALGAHAGVRRLQELGLPVAAASGVLTASPLAAAEADAALAESGVPVIGTYDLTDPACAVSVAGVEVGADR